MWNQNAVFRAIAVMRAMVLMGFIVLLPACSGGGGGSSNTTNVGAQSSGNNVSSGNNESINSESSRNASSAISSSVQNTAGEVFLSGTLTYDWVAPALGFATQERGSVFLDYDNILAKPMRRLTVQLLDDQDRLIAQTVSSESGDYAFNVTAQTLLKVRVLAQLNNAQYFVDIKDNTQADALYVLDGALASTGSNAAQTRNLHAPLGWDAAQRRYATQRVSAPFALLDILLESIDMIVNAAPQITLPSLTVFWSPRNIALGGDFAQGQIGSSLYSTRSGAIYVLGHEDNDTDEFDRAVIQHEFGHYVENKLSRSESIGGSHTLGVPIDMRVAFGEGFGNAFAAMSANDPFYLDTSTRAQQNGFGFSVESNRFGGGHYSESAIHAILFDLFDDTQEEGDNVSLGFAPILQTLQDPAYKGFDGLSSIYPFAHILMNNQPSSAELIGALLRSQNINGVGLYGQNETANGGSSISLPVYHSLSLGGSVNVCSNNNVQEYNGHEVNRFVLVNIPSAGTYTLTASRVSGIQPSNPAFEMYRNGSWAGQSKSTTPDREQWTRRFEAGNYALVVHDSGNTDENTATGGLVCFAVSLSQ